MGAATSGAKASGVCLTAALLLAACSASGGGGGNALGNLLAFNSLSAPPLQAQNKVIKVDCPAVLADDSTSSDRVFVGGSQSSDQVRYQYDIAQLARQCDVENGQLAIKVGVEGRLVLGPAGAAGSFVAPVHIQIKRQSDGKVLVDKVYRTNVTVPAATGEAVFDTVSEPLVVPFTREQADQDYSISVGFAQRDVANPVPRGKRRRRG